MRRFTLMPVLSLINLMILPLLVRGDKITAFNIKSVNCQVNSATIDDASCGLNGDPCELGENIELSGTYTVSTQVVTEIEVCAKLQVMGVQVYNVGCKSTNVCEYLEW
jgi:hypothetical protein